MLLPPFRVCYQGAMSASKNRPDGRRPSRWTPAAFVFLVSVVGCAERDDDGAASASRSVAARPAAPTPSAGFDAGTGGPVDQPPRSKPGPDISIEEEFEQRFARNTQRAEYIGLFAIGSSTEGPGEYPDGEVEPMTTIALQPAGVALKAPSSAAAPAAGLLNDTRKPLAAGSYALLFLRQTPGGHWFILSAVPQAGPSISVDLTNKIQENL